MNQPMKTILNKCLWCLPALLMVAFFTTMVRADNPCIEGGPYTNYLFCSSPGTLASGYVLTPTNITVSVGQSFTQPAASNVAMTTGQESYYVSYDCTPELDGWITDNINYSLGSVYFVPAIPSVFWTPGTYTYSQG